MSYKMVGSGEVAYDSPVVYSPAHTFVSGQAVYYTGAAWALAQSNAPGTLGLGVIFKIDADHFKVILSGLTHGLSGLVSGSYYYVSDAVAGVLTVVPPVAPTSYRNPLLLAISATEGIVLPWEPASLAVSYPGGTWTGAQTEADISYKTIHVNDLDYDATGVAYLSTIQYDTITKINTVTLPDAATYAHKRIRVADRTTSPTNHAGSFQIRVASAGGTLSGYTQITINERGGDLTFESDGTNWGICGGLDAWIPRHKYVTLLDTPPNAPGAKDDEFAGLVGQSGAGVLAGKWTAWNLRAGVTTSLANSYFTYTALTEVTAGDGELSAITQPISAGDCAIQVQLRAVSIFRDVAQPTYQAGWGLSLHRGTTAHDIRTLFFTHGGNPAQTSPVVAVDAWTNFQTLAGASLVYYAPADQTPIYLKITRTGTMWAYWFSTGGAYTKIYEEAEAAMGWTPMAFGISGYCKCANALPVGSEVQVGWIHYS